MKQLFIAITFTLLSFIVSAQEQDAEATYPKLPALNLQMADGSALSTQDLLGQPYILHFWATWCPYCKKLQPALQKINDMGVKVIAVSFKEDDDATPAKALSDRGYTFKTAVKADATAQQLGIRGTPTTLFVNKEGNVIWLTNTSNPEDTNLHLKARTLLHSISEQ
ncbi:TlpA disulfide reductase family protein [Pseudoalteromonas sp. Z1A8]|uniref:TlpA family protein disulfide reductase n=1 Tax=Pseudoalteromonas sp. Z1A8 TaxID=2686354 RepID=UPI00140C3597|nr:TlpA disulfide reductase family protein [Pseudoalteromonas sp. Z1A8]